METVTRKDGLMIISQMESIRAIFPHTRVYVMDKTGENLQALRELGKKEDYRYYAREYNRMNGRPQPVVHTDSPIAADHEYFLSHDWKRALAKARKALKASAK